MTPRLAPHQTAAVERVLALLERYGGALLADEVGLGKSWVAASVAKEVSSSAPVELIVPPALVQQWRLLAHDFGLDAVLITHDSLHGKLVYPGAGEPRLLVVDEAHRFRNPGANRHRALALRSVGNRLLFVTATPICNRLEDLYALLKILVADDALSDRGVLSLQQAFETRSRDSIAVTLNALVVRRSRAALPPELQFGTLRRDIIRFRVARDQEMRRAVAKLRFPLIAFTDAQIQTLHQFLWRRLESSIAALLDSLRRQKRFYHRVAESLTHGVELNKRDYRRIFSADDDELLFQDLLFRDFWAGYQPAAKETSSKIEQELSSLSSVEMLLRDTPDLKLQQLLALIEENSSEQILVFTGAVATARDVFHACSGLTRTALLTSRLHFAHRFTGLTFEQVLDSFRAGETRVLVLTDLGAEGLNLQNASMVIHYDMPWNPVRLDQRNGRIHRIGQVRELVRAIYFLPAQRCDQIVLRCIASKNRLRRRVLGEHVPDKPPESRVIPFDSLRSLRAGPFDLLRSFRAGPFDSLGSLRAGSPVLRPRLFRSDPQALLVSRLARERPISAAINELMMRRYRYGAELVIRQMSGEYLDASRVRDLETLLHRELEVTARIAPHP